MFNFRNYRFGLEVFVIGNDKAACIKPACGDARLGKRVPDNYGRKQFPFGYDACFNAWGEFPEHCHRFDEFLQFVEFGFEFGESLLEGDGISQ